MFLIVLILVQGTEGDVTHARPYDPAVAPLSALVLLPPLAVAVPQALIVTAQVLLVYHCFLRIILPVSDCSLSTSISSPMKAFTGTAKLVLVSTRTATLSLGNLRRLFTQLSFQRSAMFFPSILMRISPRLRSLGSASYLRTPCRTPSACALAAPTAASCVSPAPRCPRTLLWQENRV